jgi:hypothetical protein
MRPSPLRAFAECARKERPCLLAVVNSNARSKPDHPGENRRSDSNRSTYRAVDGRGAAAGWLRKTTGGCNFCNVEYFVQSKTMEWEDCLQEGSHEASDESLVLLHSALTGRMASAGMLSPDCATLHPGLFSSASSGGNAGSDRPGREEEQFSQQNWFAQSAWVYLVSTRRTRT